jgi:hypothetical protein
MDKKASIWSERFNNAEQAQFDLFNRVSKYYDIMYAVQNTSNIAPWRAKVFIPILASKAWDLVSRLSNVVPYFQTKIDELELEESGFVVPETTQNRQMRLDAKLKKDYTDSPDEPMKLKVSDTLLDAVVAGTGWAKQSWETKKEVVYNKQIDEDGMVKNPDKDEKTEYEKGYNCFEPLNFFNVFIAPNAPSWGKANYIIVRYFKPFEELKNNPNYDLKKLYDQPQTIGFSNQNNSRNRIVNEKTLFQEDKTVKTATIYECYERKSDGWHMSTYAEGQGDARPWVQIRQSAKRYWHKYCPIVPFYIRRKTFSPWGESLFENNATLQSATNDIFNHYLDNLNVSLDSMIMYEDGTLTNDFVVEPGGEITYTGAEPKQFKFPEPNPAQISMVMNQLEKAIELATVPQYISGVPDSSTDKTAGTAKGISLITEAATEKIGFMKDNFKQSMTIVGKIWLSNLAQFQDKPDRVDVQKDGKIQPDVVLPEDYQGEISLTIDDDSMLPLTKDERRDIALQFLGQVGQIQKLSYEQANFFQDPSGVPKIKYGEFIEELAQYFSVKDVTRYMEPATAPMSSVTPPPEEGAMPGGGQTNVEAALQGDIGAALGGMSAGNQQQL